MSSQIIAARLRLLGAWRLYDARTEQPVAVPNTAKRVLALLALGGRVARSHVAGTIWPELDERHAHGALRSAIYRLHRVQPSLVVADDDGLELDHGVQVDVGDLQDAANGVLSEGRRDDNARCRLVRQTKELLPGWYDDWVIFERERLRQLRLQALETLAAHLLAEQRYPEAVQTALEAIAVEPLRETGQRLLVQIHLTSGNAVEAIRQYDNYRHLLQRDLGLPPSRAMRLLVEQAMVPA
jgi:DNA-binding SARP family transcriptional activator